jgi:hypothetical protein
MRMHKMCLGFTRKESGMAPAVATNGKAKAKGRAEAGAWNDDPERAAKNGAHLEALESTPPVTGKPIILPRLDIRSLLIRIIGDSELICHNWSQKAIQEMLSKQMGVATAGKEPKNPDRDYHDSFYPYPGGGYGFPAIAFKNAAVTACTSLGKAVTKVQARQAFHVVGELVKLKGEPRCRQDMVRVGMGTADIRYRGAFPQWETEVTVRYNARVLTDEQIVNLFNTAGFAVGVGEWRSEKDGQYGLFHVG